MTPTISTPDTHGVNPCPQRSEPEISRRDAGDAEMRGFESRVAYGRRFVAIAATYPPQLSALRLPRLRGPSLGRVRSGRRFARVDRDGDGAEERGEGRDGEGRDAESDGEKGDDPGRGAESDRDLHAGARRVR